MATNLEKVDFARFQPSAIFVAWIATGYAALVRVYDECVGAEGVSTIVAPIAALYVFPLLCGPPLRRYMPSR